MGEYDTMLMDTYNYATLTLYYFYYISIPSQTYSTIRTTLDTKDKKKYDLN